jgi:hypothetical protein
MTSREELQRCEVEKHGQGSFHRDICRSGGSIRKMLSKLGTKTFTLFDSEVWKFFFNPGEVTEVRIPKVLNRGTVSGYFDDHEIFCKEVKKADKELNHDGIYFTLQVIDPRLLARAFNRLKVSSLTTSDNNVISYRWLPVDTDPVRPAGISSSDSELREALQLRDEVAVWAMDQLKLPYPIRAMSGNGGHLLFRLPDLHVNDESKRMIKTTLERFARQFDNEKVNIDTSVFNPGRIWKLYGTNTHKGDVLPAGPYRESRPHRMSYIENIGGTQND